MSDAAVEGRAAAAPEGSQGPAQQGSSLAAGRSPWPRRSQRFLRRHWLFAVVLAGGAALRVVVMLGYPPAMWFNDSYSYVWEAVHASTATNHPSGYPFFLILLWPLHSFAALTLIQHLMGLGMAVLIYAVLRRRGLPAWAATLAAVPVLYDAYQVQLEQQVMSDALFMLLVTAGVVMLSWSDRLSWKVAATAGVLLALATLVRSAGLLLLVVAAVVLLIRRAGWRRVAAMLAAGAVPIVSYMVLFHLQHGPYELTQSDGTFLYGRVSSFAECSAIKPPKSLTVLCDPRPPAARPIAVEYIWDWRDPLKKLGPGLFSAKTNTMAQQFALRAIEAQPLNYLSAVVSDTWRAFGWSHNVSYDPQTDALYLFSVPPPQIPRWGYWKVLHAYQPGLGQPSAVQPFAGFLGRYQRAVYLPGTVLGLLLLTGMIGLVVRWRRTGTPGLLAWAVAVMLLVLPVATSGFSYRYELAVAPIACLAAGLAFGRDWATTRQAGGNRAALAGAGGEPAGTGGKPATAGGGESASAG